MPIEYGLTNYFSGSFQDRSLLGETAAKVLKYDKPYFFNLDNRKKLKGLIVEKFGPDVYEMQNAWGGIFWEIRGKLGRNEADKLLYEAWRSLTDQENTRVGRSFISNLMTQARQRLGENGATSVRRILTERGVKDF